MKGIRSADKRGALAARVEFDLHRPGVALHKGDISRAVGQHERHSRRRAHLANARKRRRDVAAVFQHVPQQHARVESRSNRVRGHIGQSGGEPMAIDAVLHFDKGRRIADERCVRQAVADVQVERFQRGQKITVPAEQRAASIRNGEYGTGGLDRVHPQQHRAQCARVAALTFRNSLDFLENLRKMPSVERHTGIRVFPPRVRQRERHFIQQPAPERKLLRAPVEAHLAVRPAETALHHESSLLWLFCAPATLNEVYSNKNFMSTAK